ncbi:hypothetical protein NPIL_482571 [Nephila pilipes]|uniref:Uncharacterized protein n=1 Tax=Nephila pilipes TaxID=299642 RepID=A0A8X6T8F1_NEPPI|nr:hypothetical protein NPIL_482571 [Nephila pilipes]
MWYSSLRGKRTHRFNGASGPNLKGTRHSIHDLHTSLVITGSVLYKKEESPRTIDGSVKWVRETFLLSPKKSVHSTARQLQISRPTVHMGLPK